jgi:hypothetical protein
MNHSFIERLNISIVRNSFSYKSRALQEKQMRTIAGMGLFHSSCFHFLSVINALSSILGLALTVSGMKHWGLRASSLSADKKTDAGQKYSIDHLNPNVLYMMLYACALFSFFLIKRII